MDRLRPEFKSGLDELTRFVFERTRPKQVGATVMTGPIFAGITQSFLDALNNGAVPTITSSWQVSSLSNMFDLSIFAGHLYCIFLLISKDVSHALKNCHKFLHSSLY